MIRDEEMGRMGKVEGIVPERRYVIAAMADKEDELREEETLGRREGRRRRRGKRGREDSPAFSDSQSQSTRKARPKSSAGVWDEKAETR